MAIIMGKGCLEAIYGLMGWKGLITNTVAALVNKTHVLPMLDYGDFLVDSGKLSKTDRPSNLHKRALKLIDNKAHRDQDIAQLMSTYGLESLLKRREKHHLSLMYRLKDDKDLLEQYRANIELRNHSKIKFKTRTSKLTKVANSPYYRRVWLWDCLNESTQKATTKLKFKQSIAS